MVQTISRLVVPFRPLVVMSVSSRRLILYLVRLAVFFVFDSRNILVVDAFRFFQFLLFDQSVVLVLRIHRIVAPSRLVIIFGAELALELF